MKFFKEMKAFSNFLERENNRNNDLEQEPIEIIALGGFYPEGYENLNESRFKSLVFESKNKEDVSRIPIFLEGSFMEAYISHFPPFLMKQATSYLLGQGLYEAKNLLNLSEKGGPEFGPGYLLNNVRLGQYLFDIPSDFFISLLEDLEKPINLDALQGMSLEDKDARRQYEEDGFGYYEYNFDKKDAKLTNKSKAKRQILSTNWSSLTLDTSATVTKRWLEATGSGWLGDIKDKKDREFDEIDFKNNTAKIEYVDQNMEIRKNQSLSMTYDELNEIHSIGEESENSYIRRISPNGEIELVYRTATAKEQRVYQGFAPHFKTGKAVSQEHYELYRGITKAIMNGERGKIGKTKIPDTPEEYQDFFNQLQENATTADAHEYALRQYNINLQSMETSNKVTLGGFQLNRTQRQKTELKDNELKNNIQEYFVFYNYDGQNDKYKVRTVGNEIKDSYFTKIIRINLGGTGRDIAYNSFINEAINSGAFYVINDSGVIERYVKEMIKKIKENNIEEAEDIYTNIETGFIKKKASSWSGIVRQLFEKHKVRESISIDASSDEKGVGYGSSISSDAQKSRIDQQGNYGDEEKSYKKGIGARSILRQQDDISDPFMRSGHDLNVMRSYIEQKQAKVKQNVNNFINKKAKNANTPMQDENKIKEALDNIVGHQKEILLEYKELFIKKYEFIGGRGVQSKNIQESALNWALHKLEIERNVPKESMMVQIPQVDMDKLYNEFNQQLAARSTQQTSQQTTQQTAQPQVKLKASQEEINQAANIFNNPQVMQLPDNLLIRDENQIRLANIFLYQVPNTPQNQEIKQKLSKIPEISSYDPDKEAMKSKYE